MQVVKEVGKRIRKLRTERQDGPMTQKELAGVAQISISFLSMIERGERSPHLDTLARLAGGLEVPVAELFAFDADPEILEPLYRPLVQFCRKQAMTRREVERLVAVARSMYS